MVAVIVVCEVFYVLGCEPTLTYYVSLGRQQSFHWLSSNIHRYLFNWLVSYSWVFFAEMYYGGVHVVEELVAGGTGPCPAYLCEEYVSSVLAVAEPDPVRRGPSFYSPETGSGEPQYLQIILEAVVAY
jgi:hypothetical protein